MSTRPLTRLVSPPLSRPSSLSLTLTKSPLLPAIQHDKLSARHAAQNSSGNVTDRERERDRESHRDREKDVEPTKLPLKSEEEHKQSSSSSSSSSTTSSSSSASSGSSSLLASQSSSTHIATITSTTASAASAAASMTSLQASNNSSTQQQQQHHTNMSQTKKSKKLNSSNLLLLEEEVISLKAQLSSYLTHISSLQHNCELLSSLCYKHMCSIETLTSENRELVEYKQLYNVSQNKYEQHEQLMNRGLKEQEHMADTIKNMTARYDATQHKMAEAQEQIENYIQDKNEMQNKYDALNHLLTQRNIEIEELKQQLKHAIQSLESSANSNQHHAQKSSSIEESRIREEMDSKLKELEDLKSQQKNFHIHQQKLTNQLQRIEHEYELLQNDNKRYKSLLNNLRKENDELNAKLLKVKDLNSQLSTSFNNLQTSHNNLAQQLPQLQQQVAALEKEKTKLKQKYDVCWSEKEDLLLQLNEVNDKYQLMCQQLEILRSNNNTTNDNAEALATLRADHIKLQKVNDELESKLKNYHVQLQTTHDELSEAQKKYRALNDELSALTSSYNSLQTLHNSIKSQSNSTQNNIENMQNAMKIMNENLDALNQQKQKQTEEITSLNSIISQQKTDINKLQQELITQKAAHEKEMKSLESRVENETREAYIKQFKNLESQVSSLTSDLNKLQHENLQLNALLDGPRMSSSEILRMKKQQEELNNVIAKLIVNETASENSFTCFMCLNIFNKPVTCIPCGHSYCVSCVEKSQMCTQCRPPAKVTYYSNELLEELSTRYVFRKQSLQALKDIVKSD